MPFHVPELCEPLVTDCALERFHSRMDVHVRFQMRSLGERFIAHAAVVCLCQGVNVHVPRKVATLRECFSTFSAHVRTLLWAHWMMRKHGTVRCCR